MSTPYREGAPRTEVAYPRMSPTRTQVALSLALYVVGPALIRGTYQLVAGSWILAGVVCGIAGVAVAWVVYDVVSTANRFHR